MHTYFTAFNLSNTDYGVAIIPEFGIDDTRLKPTQSIALSPKFALLSDEFHKLLSCCIYEAKPKSDDVMWALPQAASAMVAAAKAKHFRYVIFVSLNTPNIIYLITGSTISEAALRLVGNGSFSYLTALRSGYTILYGTPRTREELEQHAPDLGITARLGKINSSLWSFCHASILILTRSRIAAMRKSPVLPRFLQLSSVCHSCVSLFLHLFLFSTSFNFKHVR